MENVRFQTPYYEDIKDINRKLKDLKRARRDLVTAEEEYIIANKAYYSMDQFPKMFKEMAGDDMYPELNLTLVVRTRRDGREWKDPFILIVDDAGDCEWPRLDDDHHIYWNTYNCGILEWDDNDNSYVWWRHHTKTYVDILGFVAIEHSSTVY